MDTKIEETLKNAYFFCLYANVCFCKIKTISKSTMQMQEFTPIFNSIKKTGKCIDIGESFSFQGCFCIYVLFV